MDIITKLNIYIDIQKTSLLNNYLKASNLQIILSEICLMVKAFS